MAQNYRSGRHDFARNERSPDGRNAVDRHHPRYRGSDVKIPGGQRHQRNAQKDVREVEIAPQDANGPTARKTVFLDPSSWARGSKPAVETFSKLSLDDSSRRDDQKRSGASDLWREDAPRPKCPRTAGRFSSSTQESKDLPRAASPPKAKPTSNDKHAAQSPGLVPSHTLSHNVQKPSLGPTNLRLPTSSGVQNDANSQHISSSNSNTEKSLSSSSLDKQSLPKLATGTRNAASRGQDATGFTPHLPPSRQQPKLKTVATSLPDRSKKSRSTGTPDEAPPPPPHEDMVKQLDTRTIPIDQVRKELEAIYGVVTTLENKCKHVLQSQKNSYRAYAEGKVKDKPEDHFTLVLALHRNLIHEEYDLFRASQYATTHPDARRELDNFAEKVELPARLWKHGIHGLLELFRTRLPESREYLNAYIILGYQMFTLLLETVTDFQNQWLECLGDISRYRMAIETASAHERDLWLNLSDAWYTKASTRQPDLGRLLHHRAILARSKGSIPMLNLYARSLTTNSYFPTARDSLNITTWQPNLALNLDLSSASIADLASKSRSKDTDKFCTDVLTRVHAAHYTNDTGKFNAALQVWHDCACRALLSSEAHKEAAAASGSVSAAPIYSTISETIALANIAALFDWGADGNALRDVFTDDGKNRDQAQAKAAAEASKKHAFRPWYLLIHTFMIHLLMKGHEIVLPHLHVQLVFLWRLSACPYGILYIPASYPWSELASHLNSLQMRTQTPHSKVSAATFVHAGMGMDANLDEDVDAIGGNVHVLREDQCLRGLIWARSYLPDHHFDRLDESESDEGGLLAAGGAEAVGTGRGSVGDARVRGERCLWLAHRVVAAGISAAKAALANTAVVRGFMGRQWLGFEEHSGFFVMSL